MGLQESVEKMRQLAEEKQACSKGSHGVDLPDTHYICSRCTRDSCSCLSLHTPVRHFKGTLPPPLPSKNIVVIFTLYNIYMYINLSTYFNMYM